MAEFFNVLPPDEARDLLLGHIEPLPDSDLMPTHEALGRVTFEPVHAPGPLPAFRRSTMDGYAVRAGDTHGAGENLPALLSVVGEVKMGQPADIIVGVGESALVHTGGMIPDSADAVVPVEFTQPVEWSSAHAAISEIEVYRPVAAGQNVIQIGEDVTRGALILPRGALVRPQDVGGLLAFGIVELKVTRRPLVAILATGDEVVPPEGAPGVGQVRDINSYTVSSQCLLAGGIPCRLGIIPDDFEALRRATAAALAENDMVVISAGSSVSARDMTVDVIKGLGEPGVLLHGVATRPGKPTIVGAVGGKPILGLPGNPVSAMVQFDMFGPPAIGRLQGMSHTPVRNRVWATLTLNVPSESGREDYIPARLEQTDAGLTATPVFGKSNLIFTLIQTDGLIKVPLNRSGLTAGSLVEVIPF